VIQLRKNQLGQEDSKLPKAFPFSHVCFSSHQPHSSLAEQVAQEVKRGHLLIFKINDDFKRDNLLREIF
jgi:hypothetical protein